MPLFTHSQSPFGILTCKIEVERPQFGSFDSEDACLLALPSYVTCSDHNVASMRTQVHLEIVMARGVGRGDSNDDSRPIKILHLPPAVFERKRDRGTSDRHQSLMRACDIKYEGTSTTVRWQTIRHGQNHGSGVEPWFEPRTTVLLCSTTRKTDTTTNLRCSPLVLVLLIFL